ncbi:recombination associated protein [Catenovulum agarivorans DS-2]|uniref:Recombination-associated protein RdgC n=1 Tax=Catenovulum agarivorans DS-2 TaxID=1328313 RepID=W7QA59_9ALTE|nr:recombination-associated protein RdgC [Catenovulum agarivorans]EWH08886.1 recombination associated protein [Catenovulum agarivorans DS-2]
MWFKNALLYRFTSPFEFSAEQLEEKLKEFEFTPCLKSEMSSIGWTKALHPKAHTLVHSAGAYHLLSLKKQEKVLPASVVKELLEEKLEQIEQAEGRKVKGKEKQNLKEELIHTLLPQAFSKSSCVRAAIFAESGWILVEAGSAGKAEEFLAYLRKCLGTLPVVPPETDGATMLTFDEWMKGNHPSDFTLGTEVELKDFAEDEGVLRCKNLALDSEDLLNHLNNGKHVTKIAVDWQETLSCILCDDMAIKRIKFSDVVKEQNEDVTDEDKLARLDADFALMCGELDKFVARLAEVLEFTSEE